MDTSRISFGEMVAGVSALLLLIFMFALDWFGYEDGGGGASAFQWMSFLDIILLLICLVTIGLVVARAAGEMPNLPYPPGLIIAAAGALAVLIVLFRLLVPGDGPLDGFGLEPDPTRKIGAFLGLIAAAGIAFGGWTAMNERSSGTAPTSTPGV